MPSAPESGAIRISTLSCSTNFLAARSAESGLASDEPLMISSSLPPALLWCCMTARSKPRMPSSPSAVYVPSRVEKNPTLILSAAWADPAKLAAARPATNAIPMVFRIFVFLLVSEWGLLRPLRRGSALYAFFLAPILSNRSGKIVAAGDPEIQDRIISTKAKFMKARILGRDARSN